MYLNYGVRREETEIALVRVELHRCPPPLLPRLPLLASVRIRLNQTSAAKSCARAVGEVRLGLEWRGNEECNSCSGIVQNGVRQAEAICMHVILGGKRC